MDLRRNDALLVAPNTVPCLLTKQTFNATKRDGTEGRDEKDVLEIS